jgi:hypothetical protein
MPPAGAWCARVAIPDGVGYKIATNIDASKWRNRLGQGGDMIEYRDDARGVYCAPLKCGVKRGGKTTDCGPRWIML